MTDFLNTASWCTAQVSLAALAGLLFSAWLTKGGRDQQGFVVCGTMVVVAVLTIVCPLPIHDWFMHSFEQRNLANPEVTQILSGEVHSKENSRLNQRSGADGDSPTIPVQGLVEVLRRFSQHMSLANRMTSAVSRIALCAVCVTIFIGVLRFVVAVVWVWRIRHSGRVITDADVTNDVIRLSRILGRSLFPEVRETSALTTAAVIGVIRPRLMLPVNWRDWSTDERRSVIAHELAHVVARDSLWRLFFSAVTAVHCVNPLVHRLFRQSVLHQELAADAMAAQIVGVQRYLRSLSSIALRQDDAVPHPNHLIVVPVFSGQLIRRIQMLRSMDGSSSFEARQRLGRTLAVATLLFLAGASIAVRGFAQTGDSNIGVPPRKTDRVAAVSRSRSLIGDASEDSQRSARKEILASVVRKNETGMAAIRVSELFNLPSMTFLQPLVTAQLLHLWQAEFPERDVPAIDLTAIEWMAAPAIVAISENPAAAVGHQNSFSIGTHALTIRFQAGINLEDWMQKFMPTANRHVTSNDVWFELPPIKFLGPHPVWVSQPTLHTMTAELRPAGDHQPPSLQSTTKADAGAVDRRWIQSWKALQGNLVSLVFSDAKIENLLHIDDRASDFDRIAKQFASQVTQRCSSYAYGLDVDSASGTLLVTSRLSHGSMSPAQQTQEDSRSVIQAISALPPDETSSAADRRFMEILKSGLQCTTVSIEQLDASTVDVVWVSQFAIGDLLGIMMN